MILKKAIITAGLLSLMVHFIPAFAQEPECDERYQLALSQYNYGLADSALSLLEPCLFNKRIHKELTPGESTNIYRLATLSSIMNGNSDDAEKYVREMLEYAPDYAENWREDDLMEFRHMIEGASPQPSLRLGLRTGLQIPALELRKNYTDPEKPGASFSLDGRIGAQLVAVGELAISRNMTLEAGLGVLQVFFDYSVEGSGFENYKYEQAITYLEIPVLVKYYVPLKGALKPYVQAGLSGKFSLYLREKSEDYGKYWFTESSDEDYVLATFITDLENLGIAAGAGISYDLKNFSMRLDLRYDHHPYSNSKMAKIDDIHGYEDIPEDEAFGYTHDINLITLSGLQISFALAYNLKYKVY